MTRILCFRCAVVLLIATVTIATFAREWTSSTGKRLEAELVEVKSGKAKLKKPDGTMIDVPVRNLSKADQKYLKTASASKPDAPAQEDTPAKKEDSAPEADAAAATKVDNQVDRNKAIREAVTHFKSIGALAGTPHASAAYPTYNKKAVLIKPGVAIVGTEPEAKLKTFLPADEKDAFAAGFCALNRLIRQEHKGKYAAGFPMFAYDTSGPELMNKVVYFPEGTVKIIKVSEKDLGLAPDHLFSERMRKVDEYAAKKLKAAGLPTGEKMQDDKDAQKTLIEIIVIDGKAFSRLDSN